MSDDYYDPGPRIVLRRPVVVTALDIRPARRVVHLVGARYGLNVVHHSDWVQHEAGTGYAELLADPARLAALEAGALDRALGDTPPPLVSLPGRLVHEDLLERADLVLLLHHPLAPPDPVDGAIIMGVGVDVPALTARIAALDIPRIHARPEARAVTQLGQHLEGLIG